MDAGLLTLSTRQAYGVDGSNRAIDARWRARYGADYGITDDYALGVFVQTDRRQGDNTELEALLIDQRFEVHDVKSDGFYSGVRLRYTKRDGDKGTDDVHLRLIAGAPFGQWEARFNQLFIYELGDERREGLFLESRAHVSYGLESGQRIGIESFNHFGRSGSIAAYDTRNYEIGPVLTGKFDDGLAYDVSYRKGLNEEASDHVFRLVLSQGF